MAGVQQLVCVCVCVLNRPIQAVTCPGNSELLSLDPCCGIDINLDEMSDQNSTWPAAGIIDYGTLESSSGSVNLKLGAD